MIPRFIPRFKLPSIKKWVGLLSLLGSLLLMAASILNLIMYYAQGHYYLYAPSYVTAESVGLALITGYALSFYLMRDEGMKMQIPIPDIHSVKPQIPEQIEPELEYKELIPSPSGGFESILERALMNNMLGADLSVTLKLPSDTKLKIMGQTWEVNEAQIIIAKKQPEPQPTLPPAPVDDILTRLHQLDADKEMPPV